MYRSIGNSINNQRLNTTAGILQKVCLSVVMVFLLFSSPVLAELSPADQAKLDEIERQNSAYKDQLNSLYAQERTLANEIAIVDAQAAALQAQIYDTSVKIDITSREINATRAEIKAAEEELVRQKAILQEYIKTMYIDGQVSQVELILTSSNFSDFVDRNEYMDTMQNKVQETLDKIAKAKEELEAKMNGLEIEEAKLEVLRAGQIAQTSVLNAQAEQKSRLISGNKSTQGSIEEQIAANDASSYIIRCLASGACGGSANGDLVVVNNVRPYYAQTSIPGTYDGYHTYAMWGCLITSLAMAHNVYPTVEASNHSYDSQGNMYGDSTSGSQINWATANAMLMRGEKVIMGLNIGHFVLAVGYANGKYLINDPYPGLASTGAYDKSQVTKLLRP